MKKKLDNCKLRWKWTIQAKWVGFKGATTENENKKKTNVIKINKQYLPDNNDGNVW